MTVTPEERTSFVNSAPIAAATGYALLYVALALVFTRITAEGLVIGALVSAVVVYIASRFLGEKSRVTVLGGFVFVVAAAIAATILS